MADDFPVDNLGTLVHFVDGSLAFAGRYLHDVDRDIHTHSFVEVAVVLAGAAQHRSLAGRRELAAGDVVLLRPGVWHGYEECADLMLYNCGFSPELLRRELAWTREDPQLGHLLWTGPYARQRRGILTAHLGADRLAECVEHLDGLHDLRSHTVDTHRGDIVGRLALFLSVLAREAARADGPQHLGHATHPAVLEGMRLMEERPGHQWTLTELALALHLAPGYLVRLFKAATGLPPMAYLSRHRVELAAARLLHTDLPINKIASRSGGPIRTVSPGASNPTTA